DLTLLEYIILGLLSVERQSGYSIIGTLERGIYRWKASPGSIYPALKRLEKHEIISSTLEIVNETRSRKIYELTEQGQHFLDTWLREMPALRGDDEDRDTMLIKFLFAENRLTRDEILAMLDAYERLMAARDEKLRIFYEVAKTVSSVHQKLIYEAVAMERAMQR